MAKRFPKLSQVLQVLKKDGKFHPGKISIPLSRDLGSITKLGGGTWIKGHLWQGFLR